MDLVHVASISIHFIHFELQVAGPTRVALSRPRTVARRLAPTRAIERKKGGRGQQR